MIIIKYGIRICLQIHPKFCWDQYREPKKALKYENNMTSIAFEKQYVVNEKGDRIGVLLSLEDCKKLLDELEDLDSLRAYDAAKASGEEAIPFEEAIADIERERDHL